MKWFRRAVTVVFVLCLSAIAAVVYETQHKTAQAAAMQSADADTLGQFTPLTTPRPAPAVNFTTRQGKLVTLDDFRGRMLLVNLWATWCGPCIKEMPSLQRMQRELGAKLTVLAISEDRNGAQVVDPFIAKFGLDGLATFLDPKNEASSAFGVQGLPTSILIDRKGRILGELEGDAEWDSPAMLGLLRPYLGETAPEQMARPSSISLTR